MNKKINSIIKLMLLICCSTYAQMDQYTYKHKLQGVVDNWHLIDLPNEVFGHVLPNLSDVRVYGVTKEKDTVEAPYLLKLKTGNVSLKRVPFKTLNTTHNDKGAYITLEVSGTEPVNQIYLKFKRRNFDWLIALEGSQDLEEWYTITEDYRILSIQNDLTNYQFTTVRFPEAKYKYFRVNIKDVQKPVLESANVTMQVVKKADYLEYDIVNHQVKESKKNKQTIIDVTLRNSVPVGCLDIKTKDTFDYYRPVSIQYANDSIKNQKGDWILRYQKLNSGILNSIEDNVFTFRSVITKKIRIVIDNSDNKPLNVGKPLVKGYKHELVTRLIDPATYYLVYGNKKAKKPLYDLSYLSVKIPDNITPLSIEKQTSVDHTKNADKQVSEPQPLFTNKIWLWGIMGVVILLLGGFTLSMMRKK
ncbi:DUF3999 family protein [Aquimarina aquimarini]|uniref:DUF3999 family protein n=1 Tax=Aquimarina aquimarini TaxID=1191734 RepID=UPI000D552A1E|nr:DUF3999 family protein [Aquimarina aquimarini]